MTVRELIKALEEVAQAGDEHTEVSLVALARWDNPAGEALRVVPATPMWPFVVICDTEPDQEGVMEVLGGRIAAIEGAKDV